MEPTVETSATTTLPTYSRLLSDNEQSYFLQSRANGANDMLLETEFRAPAVLITYRRLSIVWAILRIQHPLLSSRVEMKTGNYQSCRFVYTPPSSPNQAICEAEACLGFQWRPEPELEEYGDRLSAPRQLSANKMAHVTLAARPGDVRPTREYRLWIDFAHCAVDGVSGHLLVNALFTLLGASSVPGQPPRSDEELETLLQLEWEKRWVSGFSRKDVIPVAAETRLQPLSGQWKIVASRVEHSEMQKRIIGGHAFLRKPAKTTKNTARMIQYTVEETKTILARCRAARVTLSNAMFSLCSMAWIRLMRDRSEYDPKLPIMIYSAVSLRHLFMTMQDMWQPSPLHCPDSQLNSWVFLAVSYFNAVLPGFIPSSIPEAAIMWHRARCVRKQFFRHSRSPMFLPRVHILTMERGDRARRFAKEDDEALLIAQRKQSTPVTRLMPPSPSKSAPAPSVALLGLSQLGNLNEFYLDRAYPSIDIFYINAHTRKNKGGMLLFTHTFRGKLCLQFGWDQEGFAPGVVEAFWDSLNRCLREYMIDIPDGLLGTGRVKL